MTERDLQQHHEATGHFGICSRQEAMSKPLSTGSRRTVGKVGGGARFQIFLFSPLFGEDSQFDSYFSNGLKPPTSFVFVKCWRIDELFGWIGKLGFFMLEKLDGKLVYLTMIRSRF